MTEIHFAKYEKSDNNIKFAGEKKMKKIILLNVYKIIMASLGLAIVLPLIAADTGQINYQARLLDSYGRRVNDTVDLSFKIYDAATAGNLLWSETQAGVVVQDGVYSVVLGSQTAIPASVFAQNNVYLELGINAETMSPRQQITASAYSLVARTVMGSNIFENQTSGYVGVGTTNPAVKLDVSGTVQATGIKMPTGASSGYLLVSDSSGAASWQAFSHVITESDPLHTNWVRVVFAPATNDLWNAIGLRAMQSDVSGATNDMWNNAASGINARVLAVTYNLATNDLWTAVNLRALQSDVSGATNDMWNNAAGGINARVLRNGDIMTAPLTNTFGFYGNGAGLTNISSSSLTGVVHITGDTMTGELIISNNLIVSGSGTWRPGGQTIADNDTTVQVAQTFAKIGTSDGVLKDFNNCALQIAPGVSGQMLIIQATNDLIRLTNGLGVTLAGGVSFSMSTNDTIQLIYDGSTWVEIQRADNTIF